MVIEANKAYSKERVCLGNKPIWKVCKMEKDKYRKEFNPKNYDLDYSKN